MFSRAALCLGALALGGCFYSSEAGKNLETRVDKLDKDLRAEQKAQAEKLDQQLPRIDQKIAEVTKALDSLDQASRRSGADTSVQLQKVIEDLAQLRGQVEAYTHNLDALQDRAAAVDKKTAAADDVPRPTDKKEFFALAQSKAKAGDLPAARSLYQDFVRKYLVDLGVAPAKLDTVGYGENRPAVEGHNEEAWAANRRVEFRK